MFESSIDETDSSSCREPVCKKHKVVFYQTPPATVVPCDVSRSPQKIKYVPGVNSHSIIVRSNKVKGELGDKVYDRACGAMGERSSYRRYIRKSRSCGLEPNALKNSRILMESILEELKVARHKMFSRMKEEMRQVMDYGTPEATMRGNSSEEETIEARNQKNFESGSDFRSHNIRLVTGSLKRTRNVNSSTGCEVIQSPELSSLVNPSYRVCSSMHLNPPTNLPEAAFTEKGRFNYSHRNHIQTGVVENRVNRGKQNGASFSGDQKENFEDHSHMGSQDTGYIGRTKFYLPLGSGFGSGHGLHVARQIQAQESEQNLTEVLDNNIFSRRANRGMGSVSSYMNTNTKTNCDAWTEANLISKSQRGTVSEELLYEE